ncbi:alpha/beta fold hydrolase [Granulosicoccus sp. 3-233]|uniref:alpha/beta fold hydrolase n=1 Tax=Granulosicoccus sp. 3-233 TaxID=3417969 RepID=UPI003D34D339
MTAILKNYAADGTQALPLYHWPATESAVKPPVVLLHSLFFDGTMFENCVRFLSKQRDCYAPTFRGQCNVDTGNVTPTIERLALDIAYLVDQLELDKFHLVGSSMGAYVAMEMIRRHNQQIASLTLSCCTAEVEKNPERFAQLSQYLSDGPQNDSKERISRLMMGQSSLRNPTSIINHWVNKFANISRNMSVVVDCVFAHPGYEDVLATYTSPALLIAGREDRAKSVEDMTRIANQLTQAQTLVFETSGHTPAVEAPELFGSEIGRFLNSVDSTQPTTTKRN